MITLGIDLGSRTTKAAIIADGSIAARGIVPTGWDPQMAALAVRERALSAASLDVSAIDRAVATGYGRVNVPIDARRITEITCHAQGLHRAMPEVRTVVDVGGQDSKVIRVDNFGLVEDFAMNDRCAAGTGRFLEFMADSLDVPMDEFANLGANGSPKVELSSICTVFAESEVLSLVAEGREVPDIVSGIHRAISRRIVGLIRSVGLLPPLAMTGGGALNAGLRHHLEELLGTEILVPDHPQTAGAEGAAWLALNDE